VDRGTLFALASLLLAGIGWALWMRAISRVAIPRDRRGYIALMLAPIALACAAFAEGVGWLSGAAAVLGLVAGAFFLVTVVISPQKGGPGAFRVGEPLPDFEALAESGERVRFSALAGSGGPVLLKFFRGHW